VIIRLKESLSWKSFLRNVERNAASSIKSFHEVGAESSFRGERPARRVREENHLKEPYGCSPFFGANHRVVFRGRGVVASGSTFGYSAEARARKEYELHFSVL